jgi:hypothetical protein
MELNINLESLRDSNNDSLKIDPIKFQKMLLIFNAIEDGWTIRKTKTNSYMFSKNHEGKREILEDSYLAKFMKTNFDLKSLCC